MERKIYKRKRYGNKKCKERKRYIGTDARKQRGME
jgi:hypothetical protein